MFAFELCERLGCADPDWLLDSIDWPTFIEWRARYELQPWGEERADLRQMVLIHYLLSPYSSGDQTPPEPLYPYFANSDLDLKAAATFIADHLRKYPDLV
jgi:hypothetical protein